MQLAVGPDQHPVLVVAEVGGAHPQRAVLARTGVPGSRSFSMFSTTASLVVQRPLGEPHVEVGPERRRAAPAARASCIAYAASPERDHPLARRRAGRGSPGSLGDHLPARGRRCSRRGSRPPGPADPARAACSEAAEPVHLVAAVVDVELPRRPRRPPRRAPGRCASPTAAHRVWPRCSGPVGLAEMNSTLIFAGERLVAAVRRTGGHHVGGDLALRAGLDGDVEEARAGDLDRADAVAARSCVGEQLAELARVGAARRRPSCRAGAPRWWRSRRAPSVADAPPSPRSGRRRAG